MRAICLFILVGASCAVGRPEADSDSGLGGTPDARRPSRPDARPGSPDARPGTPDARPGSPDARPAPVDAAIPDAAPDARILPDADPNAVAYQTATYGNAHPNNGQNITDRTWIGWRFEVTQSVTAHTLGFVTGGSSGTGFATLVQLTGSDDLPDAVDLSSSDLVITPVVFSFPASAQEVRVPVNIALSPGWYAVVFGTDAFGATSSDLSLVSRGHDSVSARTPFVLLQSNQTTFDVAHTDLRIFVEAILD